jgi:hypothetical protein
VAPEPEGSSPHSQQPASGPLPEPIESTPRPISHSHQDSFWSHSPIYASILRVASFLLAFQPKPCTLFSPLPACHMPRQPHRPWLDLPNHNWGWVQIMKLLIMQLPPFSCYFIPLWSKYSPRTVFSGNLSLSFSLSVRDQVSNSYQTTKIQTKRSRISVFVIGKLAVYSWLMWTVNWLSL